MLSIREKYVKQIMDGDKNYEFRKAVFTSAKRGDRAIIYQTAPTQKLVGFFEIGKICLGTKDKLWEKIKNDCNVSKTDYDDYCYEVGRKYAAIKIENPKRFDTEFEPKTLWEKFKPPQSYIYLPKDHKLAVALDLELAKSSI